MKVLVFERVFEQELTPKEQDELEEKIFNERKKGTITRATKVPPHFKKWRWIEVIR